MKKTLIYGGGTMGSFLGYCLYNSNHKIYFLCRNENYKACKKYGLTIQIYNNNILKKNITIKENKNFIFINNIKKIKNIFFDYIFITTKINNDLKTIFEKIEKFINKKTSIIPPCTSIPFWWFKCLSKEKHKFFEKRLNNIFIKNLKRQNIIGMTMWLSGKIEKPGLVKISHIQRGYPLKEVFTKFKGKADKLRNDIRKKCKSPIVKNIYSEIFSKSINSLAFNLVALNSEKNNFDLKRSKKERKNIYQILLEGDHFLKNNKIKIFQSISSRINQTLSSTTHTMSMLNAYKNKKEIEIIKLWESFENLTAPLNYKMKTTKKIFSIVRKKIK
tara:strand:- start:993 stop:1985 length:993 start_codon:yes stop_codon:yes gene_type:complete